MPVRRHRFYIGESARAKNGPELLAACAESRSMGDLEWRGQWGAVVIPLKVISTGNYPLVI